MISYIIDKSLCGLIVIERNDIMYSSTLIKRMKELLVESGIKNVSVGEKRNELADVMIYEDPTGIEHLAIYNAPLFPISAVENILYQYGEGKKYLFEGMQLQLVFLLLGNAQYAIEFGNGGMQEAIFYDGTWVTDSNEREVTLEKYHQFVNRRINVEMLVDSVYGQIENGSLVVNIEEHAEPVKKRVDHYLKENPLDEDFLLYYAFIALRSVEDFGDYPFDIKYIIKRIIRENREDNLLAYIRRESYSLEKSHILEWSYYDLAIKELQLIEEIKGNINAE